MTGRPRAARVRRRLAAGLVVGALAGTGLAAGAAPASAAVRTTADYWAFVDRRQADVEPTWDATHGVYLPVQSLDDARLDANMLTTHALAASAGHRGPSRRDDRVIALARALTSFPAYLEPPYPQPPGQGHVPGWTASTQRVGGQHVAIDPQIAEALVAAWEARDVVGLPDDLRRRIPEVISAVAASSFFRYPAMLLTQFNWHADLDAFAARVTGNPSFLADYRLQLQRFARGARSPLQAGRTSYLNEGMGLIYAPRASAARGAALLSSPEYESLVVSGLQHYDWAVEQGMERLPAAEEATLRQWSQRALFGDWTHAGYLNWDTSLGTRRWHLARYWGFAQQGLETMLTAGRLAAVPRQRQLATYVADRGLETYEHLAAQNGGRLPSQLWGVRGRDGAPVQDPVFTASRMAAHAARLAQERAGSGTVSTPRPWFAYDPDVPRLAVSSPAYSTAILLRHPTDDYGGVELARLLSGDGDPVSGLGGSGRAAFGLDLVRGGRLLLDTQPGLVAARRGTTRLAVRRAGKVDLRGTFTRDLVARATVATAGGRATVTTSFARNSILVTRTVRATDAATATVRLPLWGAGASARLVRTGGGGGALGGRWTRLAGARSVLLSSAVGGYRAALCRLPPDARVRLASVSGGPTSPQTRKVALVSFPVPKARSRTIALRLVPTATTPRAGRAACA